MNTPCSEFKRTEEKTTHFGYRQVREEEKARLVAEVFHSVAQRYDVMNDLMSFGLHRLWKEQTLAAAGLRRGHCVLDVASGTGDLARSCAEAVGEEGLVLMTDINESMLKIGRDRLIDAGIIKQVAYAVSDAEHLAFTDNYFDRVMIAFGLRNVTHKEQALKSMYRVLKPGGKLLVLEFSQPQSNLLSRIYDFYSFQCIPVIGEWVAKDRESYQYLVESIRLHPPQEKLKMMLAEAGFEDVTYTNWSGGIVALHQGYKY